MWLKSFLKISSVGLRITAGTEILPISAQNSLIRLLSAKERDRARAAFLKLDQDQDRLITRAECRQAQQSWFHKPHTDSQSCNVRWVGRSGRFSGSRLGLGFHSPHPMVQHQPRGPHLWEQPHQPGGGPQQTWGQQVRPILGLSSSLAQVSTLDKAQGSFSGRKCVSEWRREERFSGLETKNGSQDLKVDFHRSRCENWIIQKFKPLQMLIVQRCDLTLP